MADGSLPSLAATRPLLARGWIVKSAMEDCWSGPGVGDPENPGLGHECVDTEAEAHVFGNRADAEDEAATYNCGARVLEVTRD